MIYECINLHYTDYCNFRCKHCFVKKENCELSFDELRIIVDKISDYFNKNNVKGRINIAGGEPLLSRNIDKLIDYISEKDIAVSLITNGYYLDEDFIARHKTQIDMIGISVDSLDYATNVKIGRCYKNNTIGKDKLIYLTNLIKSANIKLKINTCVSKINLNEEFNEFINLIKPDRYKILQMVCDEKDSVNINDKVTNEEFEGFVHKIEYKSVVEHAEEIKNSYLIIDSMGYISTNNSHSSNISIFDYELEDAIYILDIDYNNYIKRYI